MAKQYNPYNAIKSIVGYKGDYHNEQSFGRDPNAAHQSALPYYKELVDNGYESLAQQLSELDYTGAKKLLGNYKPDNEFNLDNDYANLTGEVTGSGTANAAVPTAAQNNAMSAADIIGAPHPNDSSIDNLMNLGTGMTGMAQGAYDTAQGIATGTTPIQPSAATQGLLNAYNDSNNRLNGAIQYDANGNVISGLNTEHYNIGRNQLDYLNNFDVTQQPYYQGIMDAYRLGGYNAAQGAYANGAANNGGNIDSYAAANANRQQLAFTTAGMQQAMAMANQNQQNWQNLYSQMSNDLYNQGALSLQTLDIAKQMYQADTQERMNALDVQGSLASQQMESAINAFQTMVQERMNDKGITAEMAMQEKDIAAAAEQLAMKLASDERIQSGINETNRYIADQDLAGTKYTADTGLEGTKYTADTNLAATRDTNQTNLGIAGIDADARLGVAGINRDATLGAASINADADKYTAGLNYDLGLYKADKDYAGTVYSADQAFNRSQLDALNAYELQKLVNEGNLQVAQAKAGTSATGGVSDKMTKDEAIAVADYLFGEGTPEELVSYGLDQVTNKGDLKKWFKSFGLTDSEATSAVNSITNKDMGYPDGIQNIQAILKDYNREVPYYNYVQPKNPVMAQ